MKFSPKYFDKLMIEKVILNRVRLGATKSKAAKIAGIHRTTLNRWCQLETSFSKAFKQIWIESTAKRDYQKWLNHPFRGKRPPTGKGSLAFPRFGTPRIRR